MFPNFKFTCNFDNSYCCNVFFLAEYNGIHKRIKINPMESVHCYISAFFGTFPPIVYKNDPPKLI